MISLVQAEHTEKATYPIHLVTTDRMFLAIDVADHVARKRGLGNRSRLLQHFCLAVRHWFFKGLMSTVLPTRIIYTVVTNVHGKKLPYQLNSSKVGQIDCLLLIKPTYI